MRKKIAQGISLGAAAAAVALLLWAGGALERWEFVSWAWRVEFFAKPGPETHRIKLILLDQASLDWGEKQSWQSWPWPREVYGPIIDFCRRNGARAVVFDVLFTEPSVYGVGDDELLGAAIRRAPAFVAPVYLGKSTGEVTRWPREVERPGPGVEGIEDWLRTTGSGSGPPLRAAFPISEVAGSATMLANVMDEPDVDGIFRRASLFKLFDRQLVPALGLAAYEAPMIASGEIPSRRAKGTSIRKESKSPALRIDPGCFTIGSKRIPIDDSGKVILRFRGRSGTFETFSAASVIESELLMQAGEEPTIKNAGSFKDSYVFFGFSAPGLLDLRPTPISRVYPGVEIYATMLDNILSNSFLRDARPPMVAAATVLLALCSSLSVILGRKVQHTVSAFVVIMPLPFALGMAAYAYGIWWPVVVGQTAVILSLVGAVVANYATEGRQKAFIKHAFKHYLSPEVIDAILKDPSQLKLGGERRELTILFSDLQGFSSISERLDPQTLTSLLNDYLSDMTDIILEEGGTLDKYEGDAIIAFWNAPLAQPDHARRACRAALRCQLRLQERRAEFEQRTGVTMRARIGINTGEVVVGNMGSRKRFDYTVLGDAANLASRLEGANKAFGTSILVSESTWRQGRSDGIVGREIGFLRVVGRKAPVRVFELIGLTPPEHSLQPDRFREALAVCRDGRWAEALAIFDDISADHVARAYAARCRTLVQDPESSWDGVWNLTEK